MYWPDDVAKKLTWFFICIATDVHGFGLLSLESSDVQKSLSLTNILQCAVAQSELT